MSRKSTSATALIAALLGSGAGWFFSPSSGISPEELVGLDNAYAAVEREAARVGDGDLIFHVANYRAMFTAYYLLEQEEPVEPEPEPNLTPGELGGTYVTWTWKGVQGAGRPTSVDPFESGGRMEGFIFQGDPPGSYTQNGITGGSKTLKEDILVRDAVIQHWNKWGCRAYGVRRDVRFEHVRISDGTNEHGFYANMSGESGADPPPGTIALAFRWCLFENIPSQAIQIVQVGRDNEYANPAAEITPGGLILVEDTWLRNVGDVAGGARPSFALSFFETMNDVALRRVWLDNSMHDESRGALMAHRRDAVTIEDCQFDTGKLQQPMAQLWDIGTLTIRGCSFTAKGGQDWLDIQRCGLVIFEDCTGSTRVRIDGVDLGSASGLTLP